MKTDEKGCSTCPKGEEQWEPFTYSRPRGVKAVQYDYRHTDGELFSTTAKDLETARKRKSDWLIRKLVKEYQADPNCRPFDWIAGERVTPYETTEFIRQATGKVVVLGMYVSELTIKDICEELTDLRKDLSLLEDFEAGKIKQSELSQGTTFKVGDKERVKEAIRVLQEQKKERCDIDPEKPLSDAQRNLSKLPARCWSALLSDPKQLIIIKAGESGYYPVNSGAEDELLAPGKTASDIADMLNESDGVTKAQRAAMEWGSQFGWHNKAADVDRYDLEGKPIIEMVSKQA